METRLIPHSNQRVSRLCCGTMTFGAQVDASAADTMVALCLDQGVNFFDTANVYNRGAAETVLGQALKGRRGAAILASKVAAKMGDGPAESGLSRAAIVQQVEESLRRLQTDYLDIYYFHWPDYSVPPEESLEAMSRLFQSGKIRSVGASNYASWQMVQLRRLAELGQFPPVVVNQSMYNLIARGIEAELLPMCREYGIGTVIYNPLAGGLLTGKQTAGQPLPGTRFASNPAYVDRYWHEANFTAVRALAAAAQSAGRSLISVALNWILHHSPVDCVILGASSPEQLRQNLAAAAEGPLLPPTLAACDEAWQRLRGPSPKYNR